jgi:hypothetical protein
MAALMLAAALVAWLGVWGPIRISYDAVKDFQPLIAAMVALGAATLAFRGAMAKVELDRENSRRDRSGRKLGLYLRLRFRLQRAVTEMGHATVELDSLLEAAERDKTVTWKPSDFRVTEFEEINEAWEKLDLLPEPAFDHVDRLRTLMPRINALIAGISEPEKEQQTRRWYVAIVRRHSGRSLDAAENLIRSLDAAIDRLERFD